MLTASFTELQNKNLVDEKLILSTKLAWSMKKKHVLAACDALPNIWKRKEKWFISWGCQRLIANTIYCLYCFALHFKFTEYHIPTNALTIYNNILV
jgi:hypothetical protein